MSKKSIAVSAALCAATGILSGFVLFTMGRARGFEAAESSIAAETTTTESTTTTETTTTESTTESTTTTTTEATIPPMNDDDTAAVVQKSYKTGYNEGYNKGLQEGAEAQIRIYEGQGITPPPPQQHVQTAAKRTVTVSGSFTVTVRALIPDYVTDYTTPRAAVVTLNQGEPVVLRLNDTVCSKLTVGQTYTFLVTEQSVSMDASLLNSDGTVSRDALAKRSFHLSNFRAPEEGETGSNCWRVKYQ
ncbi:MAG: hypothetical protein J6Z45_03680 [Oscillospiraceae bacterium]|nr:hypothetical protein [Oscillospiraceae bacterium]